MSTFYSIVLVSLLLLSFLTGYFFPSNNQQVQIQTQYKTDGFTPSSSMPDFSNYQDVKKKKNDFFSFLLPKVKQSNDNILIERRGVFELQSALPNLTQAQLTTLSHLKDKYKVDSEDNHSSINELIKRIDIIPASLALAQAANESAWGTSRFAQKGNNLFGQWCYVKGCGLVPKQRTSSERHEVAKFKDILASIESYMRNLNSQAAYEKLRDLRAEAREDESMITGISLAKGLWSYSTRREAYIHEIQAMIRHNNLQQFNRTIRDSE
ncbi:glucosaminidase domain-containing protein [Oceaniserpentilla sp. 4NH20-0058]|uniref:glucosaminidase domain-containing protein n=1 Tax=Oceaniserpentilla sp. 4NH20-0058 TaxID=3127660 RepID=UPI003102DB1D